MVFWWLSRSRIHLGRNLANPVFEQQYSVLRSKWRFYPFSKTWFFMIFLIFFDTCFGIDFWWVLASILAPFWKPFRIKFHVFGALIFTLFLEWICNGKRLPKWPQTSKMRTPFWQPFRDLFRCLIFYTFSLTVGSLWLSLGSLFVTFGLLLLSLGVHFLAFVSCLISLP